MSRTLAVVLVVFSALLAGCATDRAVISQANQLHAGLEPAVMEDPQVSGYLQALGDRIIESARQLTEAKDESTDDNAWMFSKNMRFHIVNSKTLNAFTTGGEHMYIYNELFQQCQTEDELAAVMAHEFAHVYGRHVQKGMNRQYAMLGGAALAGGAGYLAGGEEKGGTYAAAFAGAALAAGQFIGMGYTRKDEAEADKLGFRFYTHAGWDPAHFGDFFQHMIDKGYDKTPEYLSDHPTLQSRVDKAKERAADLSPDAASWRKPPIADEARLRELQRRAAEIGRNMPNDQSLQKAQQLLSAFPSCVTPEDQPDQKEARKSLQQTIDEIRRKR